MEGDTVSFCPFNQALIVINVRSWLCDSPQIAVPWLCAHECEGEKRGSASTCMTRGCIRGAGIESLERRGRAGVTNQLWESRLKKTHPLFSPRRDEGGTDKTNLFRPKPLQMNGYHQKYQGGKQRSFPLHSASHIFLPPPLFLSHPGSNKCDRRKCIRLGGYLSSPCAHPSTDGKPGGRKPMSI